MLEIIITALIAAAIGYKVGRGRRHRDRYDSVIDQIEEWRKGL